MQNTQISTIDFAYAEMEQALAGGLAKFEAIYDSADKKGDHDLKLAAACGALSALFYCWGDFRGLAKWQSRFNAECSMRQISDPLKMINWAGGKSATEQIRFYGAKLSEARLSERSLDDTDSLAVLQDHLLKLVFDTNNNIALAHRLYACPVLLKCLSVQRKTAEMIEIEWLIFKNRDIDRVDPAVSAALLGRCADWLAGTFYVVDNREGVNRCLRIAQAIAQRYHLPELEFELLKIPLRDALEVEDYSLASELQQKMQALLNLSSASQLTE